MFMSQLVPAGSVTLALRYQLVPVAHFGKIASLQAMSKIVQYLFYYYYYYYEKVRQVRKAAKV
jgi:hypothetical protein